jgi:hypothetical protein
LTENYAILQSHYQAAYLGWWGNPCSKEAEKAYNDAKAMICEKEFALKELESKTLKIANQIKTQLRTKRITKKKKAKAKARVRREAERIPYTPSAEGRIPVPETVFENIQELVSKLKI